METKEQKQTRRTFKTQQEREELTRIRKKENKREQRKRDNETAKKPNNKLLRPVTKSFRWQFRNNFYIGLRDKSFNKFLSLTCKDTVSLNWIITKGKIFVGQLRAAGILGNYFLVYEHEGDNYHIHILADISDTNKLKSLMNLWKYGNTKIKDVIGEISKRTRIYYCTKQLYPDNHNPTLQRLIDSWELDLVDGNNYPQQIATTFTNTPNSIFAQLNSATGGDKNIGIIDSPIVQIKCGSNIPLYKKIVYRFLLWLILITIFFSGSQAF